MGIVQFLQNLVTVILALLKAPLGETSVQFYSFGIFHGLTGKPRVSRTPTKKEVLTQQYKVLVLTTVGITVAAGLMEVILATVWTSPTPNQQTAFEAMDFAWKAGVGALFGLLSGKAS